MTYLEGLNEAQQAAVLAVEGPVSVLAGAGSGKTKVLATRMYHLIRQGVAPESILAVTFTNKAAREMRERVRTMLAAPHGAIESARRGPAAGGVPFVATFHGLGRELLERHGTAIGVPRYFSIYDRDDSERVIANALKALDIEAKELSPRAVLSRISKAKGAGLSVSEYAEREGRRGFAARITAEAWRRYERDLAAERALDFDDLLEKPVRLLHGHPEVLRAAQERWRYLHIDEYQDTSALQGELVNLLGKAHRNVFVVGDIDQNIYTWRGASIENLLEFEREYPEATTIILERNYRATGTLVAAANGVIEKNVKRKEKISTTKNPPGEPIRLRINPTAEGEARWVAEQCKHIAMKQAKTAFGGSPDASQSDAFREIAVLYRTNAQSRALEEAFLHEGVPYKLLGTRFFDRKEVKDALAWARLALEPSRQADKVRAAGAPPRGIGKVTLAKLAAGQRGALKAGEAAKVEAFEAIVAELAALAEAATPSEFMKAVIEKSGMKRALFEEGGEAEHERYENVVELGALAARHDATPGKEGIAAFLAEAALASDQDELDRGPATGVSLMTVHAAKGLEFDTVFVAGMEEGLFPHAGMGGEEDRDEEEERRLFYVAMTRARHRLILTLASTRTLYGETYLTEPSSFLRDIDPALLVYDEGDGEPIIEI